MNHCLRAHICIKTLIQFYKKATSMCACIHTSLVKCDFNEDNTNLISLYRNAVSKCLDVFESRIDEI